MHDTTNLFKMRNLKSSNTHSTQNFVVLYVYVLMHALPGIVDGARNTSQVGTRVEDGARERSGRFSSFPMLEATSSRDQRMSAGTSAMHHGVSGSSAVATTQQTSGLDKSLHL